MDIEKKLLKKRKKNANKEGKEVSISLPPTTKGRLLSD